MEKIKTLFCVITALLLPVFGSTAIEPQNQELLKFKMISDLDVIKNTFAVKYAPAEWKKNFANWDLEEQIKLAKAKILSKKQITVREYQKILKKFFNSTRDYHVGVHFYSTAAAFLPLRLQSAENRYFITWMDPKFNSKTMKIGDEVVSFDGRPIHEVVNELKMNELGNPESLTDQGFAELFLTMRVGAMGHDIPKGKTKIGIKNKGINKPSPSLYTIEWFSIPEEISPGPYKAAVMHSMSIGDFEPKLKKKQTEKEPEGLWAYPFYRKKMEYASYQAIKQAYTKKAKIQKTLGVEFDDEDSSQLLNNKQGYLPPLGKIIWEAPSDFRFRSYLYETDSNKIVAYVRIAHYMEDEEAIKQFTTLMRNFEKHSDALVIDQVNNSGGFLAYMYEIISLLSTTPLRVPTQRIAITQEDVYDALHMMDMLDQQQCNQNLFAKEDDNSIGSAELDPEFINGLLTYFQFIVSEWNDGRNFTTPTYIHGVETIKPNPSVQYTKPILLLVNSMDFSCADFFPAILQDNKRATIMGTRTAGAGGFVLSQQYHNYFGVKSYTFTGSIAERVDKNPIENIGVVPDIYYELTADDLQYDYIHYVDAINAAVDTLLK